LGATLIITAGRKVRPDQFVDGTKSTMVDYSSDIKEPAMNLLRWALIFLVVSLVAALFGFGGISAASADIARILFYIFVVIFFVFLVLGLMGRRA
jgi:uncharacterized membrane protein YtjA (UPF0391 family)